MLNLRRRLIPLAVTGSLVILIGTLGYMWLEGWPLLEAFYMTIITLSTVGFGEIRPLSSNGRLFTIALILLGASTVAYGFSTLGEYLLLADLPDRLWRRRTMRQVEKLENHVIICGYGRVGKSAIDALTAGHYPVVIIEREPERVESARNDGHLVLEGDASSDEILLQAGIKRAHGLIVATGDDSLNLFIVLSARALNPNLFIVTRTVNAENAPKMRRAGADRVVSPYRIGGRHMANIVMRPHVTDFLDVVTLDNGIELWLEEFIIAPQSPLVGQTVGEANIRRRTGVTLIALIRQGGGATITPAAETRLEAGDELIVLGTREQLAVLEQLTGSAKGH